MTVSRTPTLRETYLAALLAGDPTRARGVIERALDDGLTVQRAYLDVLAPVMEEVGERWERADIGVAREHFATSVTDAVMASLGARMRVPPRGGRLAVLACTPGEQHELGLAMAADFLEAEGWEVLELGASVPAVSLAELVAEEQPDLVGLSTATEAMTAPVEGAVRLLHGVTPRPFVVLGGRAWRETAPPENADACVGGPDELVELVRERFPPVPEDE